MTRNIHTQKNQSKKPLNLWKFEGLQCPKVTYKNYSRMDGKERS